MSDSSKTTVLPSLTDHKPVLCETTLEVAKVVVVDRTVWDYRKANWSGLRARLKEEDWNVLGEKHASEAADYLTNRILDLAKTFIPQRVLKDRKSTHPWVTAKCEEALAKKNHLEALQIEILATSPSRETEELLDRQFEEETRRCNEIFSRAYDEFIQKTREEIKSMSKAEKKWWRLNRTLLGRASKKSCSIPPLRTETGEWILEDAEKASLLGRTFESKSKLPEKKGEWIPSKGGNKQSSFMLLRVSATRKILQDINADKSTGPDSLPGRILKECAEELAAPITLLAKRLLVLGEWPDCWRRHWISPLYKKEATSQAKNYRGVHLTAVLSKTVERIISAILGDYLEKSDAYGQTQWAFRAGHSCRDLVALTIATWIGELHAGKKIGLFLSDISGAFDRVSCKLLLEKLEAAGVHGDMLLFLKSYLEARTSEILVNGSKSEEFILENTIFQGTVLGPRLWNVFFQDVSVAPPKDFKETKFADDLNCFKSFDSTISNEVVMEELRECERMVLEWGKLNQVQFDALKSAFAIVHGAEGEGEEFRFLGSWIDTALRMESNVQKLLSRARPKVTALLRSARFYDRSEMIHQYKTHVLCHLELNTGSFYHALDTVLQPLDKLQTHFLKEIGLTPEQAFLEYNLAPLRARRDIGMLGLIFKCVHGLAHKDLQKLFPRCATQPHGYETRRQSNLHGWQLDEDRPGTKHALLRRSIFGLTRVWNRLPKQAVSSATVSNMQKLLTQYARFSCWQGDTDWAELFSPRPVLLRAPSHFQQLHMYVT